MQNRLYLSVRVMFVNRWYSCYTRVAIQGLLYKGKGRNGMNIITDPWEPVIILLIVAILFGGQSHSIETTVFEQ